MNAFDGMARTTVVLRGREYSVARGGNGSPLLLLHGGWAGAEMHWSRVWSRLVGRYEVVAPDLPGLGAVDQPALPSVAAYAAWLNELLASLSIERVAVVGNSFGASVAWALAGRYPLRCSALVLVDGFPMPATPAPLAWVSRIPGTRRAAIALVSRLVYNEANFSRAFANPKNVPEELRSAVSTWSRVVPRYVDILVAGDGGPAPDLKPLLVWGAMIVFLELLRKTHRSGIGACLDPR